MNESFVEAGVEIEQIDVRISHRIIQLFSEGLYSSSNKAIEELISNSFDAGARNVHVILSPDLRNPDATIVVIDDGEGMDAEMLKQHWIIGESTRRRVYGSLNRKPIGKFGIGKLSTYVLASRLTHISKKRGNYYAATMDYSNIANSENSIKGVFDEQTISIPLRTLTRQEAKDILRPWLSGIKPGYRVLDLFGKNEPESWTVAIMSDLKQMGREIKIGRFKWILQTAMPQRSDFRLFLDGDPITPPKLKDPLKRWIIGKDIIELPKPCPEEMIAREDTREHEDSIHRYGLYHQSLGRITGFFEVYEEELDAGKPKFEHSSGFFVYVHGRRVNVDDPGFGIERNLLRHGTFSRVRVVVHIDSLDEILGSSRESFQQCELYEAAQNFLRACFNLARNYLVSHDRSRTPGKLLSARISSAPGSMTKKPLLFLTQLIIENKATPFYLRFPSYLSLEEQKQFLSSLKEQSEKDGFDFIEATEIDTLDSREGIAVLDIYNKKLLINSSHPFVAAFIELFANPRTNLALEMLIMAEIFMEAHLYHMGFDETKIRDILARRDELLRQFVRSSSRRTAGMIALALIEARNDANKLEEEVRAAFEVMGYANVIRIGGSGAPDGTAEAYLAATEHGAVQRYKVGFEAKSGEFLSAVNIGVSRIARHMRKYNCDHHVVVGNRFPTLRGTAIVDEIKQHRKDTKREGKERTITLMHIDDLARLIRIISLRHVGGLSRLRELYRNCITPEESKEWIDKLASETPQRWPYKEILETIWKLAQEQPNEPIEYAAVVTELRHHPNSILLPKREVIECCRAMQVMAPEVVFARENTVEIDKRPDLILEDIRAAVGEYPEEERRRIHL